MENCNLKIFQTISIFREEFLIMIQVRISIIEGQFAWRSFEEFIRVSNGTITVKAFMCSLSGNQKEMNGYFTVDAFDPFGGAVEVQFGYGPEMIGIISVLDIQAATEALNPIFSHEAIPEATNAWLETVIDQP